MRLMQIPIDGTALMRINPKRRRLLLQSCNIANDLSYLSKLALYSHYRGKSEPETAAQMSMFFMLLRLQISKLWEVAVYWDKNLLEPVKRGNRWPRLLARLFERNAVASSRRPGSRRVRPKLEIPADAESAVLAAFNALAQDGFFETIRNKVGFHYDNRRLDTELEGFGRDYSSSIYVQSGSGNSFYRLAEDLLLRFLRSEERRARNEKPLDKHARWDDKDTEEFIERFGRKVLNASKLTVNACELLIEEILRKHMDAVQELGQVDEVEVISVPLSEGRAPYFVTRA